MSTTLYHRRFSAMRGVDLSTDGTAVSTDRFADICNMWRSPFASEATAETFPGVRLCHRFPGAIHGIWRHKTAEGDHAVIHAGTALYRFAVSLRDRPSTLDSLSPIREGLSEEEGCAFSVGERLYLLIGGEYLTVTPEGEVFSLEEAGAYIPLVYLNEEPYEQKNLLTDEMRMGFTPEVGLYGAAVGEEGLAFSIRDREAMTCAVRVSEAYRAAGSVRVPAYATVGGQSYTVVALEASAFANMTSLCRVELPETLTEIGARAFFGCTALRRLSLPSGVTRIGYAAFGECLTLSSIHLGNALEEVTLPLFPSCVSLTEVAFGGTQEAFDAIRLKEEGEPFLPDGVSITLCAYIAEDQAAYFRFPLTEPLLSLTSVELDGERIDTNFTPIKGTFMRYDTVTEEDKITAVKLTVLDRAVLDGRRVTVCGKGIAQRLSPPITARETVSGAEAVLGCRLCAAYDGRIFLSGNPRLPNTLFYSGFRASGSCDPFYFGALDFLNDGEGYIENAALLPTGSALAVIKRDGEAECGIYFHTATATGNDLVPRVYPATQGAAGLGTVGCAVNFRDDPVFLSTGGLYAIGKQGSNLERSLLCRSSRINPALCHEDLSRAKCAVALGYLFLLTEGRVYLADSRQLTGGPLGHYEYEWYLLSGIGSYTGDRPLYRYVALPLSGLDGDLTESERLGEEATGEIYSRATEQGQVYYSAEEGAHLLVDTDGERTGGRFAPATAICAIDELVLFGTGDGSLLILNTDKRGVATYRTVTSDRYVYTDDGYLPLGEGDGRLVGGDTLTELPLYRRTEQGYIAADETGAVLLDGGRATLALPLQALTEPEEIATPWYSFVGHAYPSYCAFAMEDGGLPHYAKNTEPRSVTAKVKTFPGGAFTLLYRTDRHPWRVADVRAAGRADFGHTDFSAFDFHSDKTAILSLREKARGWCEKQYRFASLDYCRPFGICHLAYSYRIAGRIKK